MQYQYSPILLLRLVQIMDKIYLLLHRDEHKKVLINSLKADVHLELKDIMQMAKVHPPVFKRTKTAVIEKQKKFSQYSLYETVSGNHGVNMKFFNTLKEGETWLES